VQSRREVANGIGRTKTRGSRRQATLSVELLELRDVPAVILVTNGNDSGAGSLRQAIIDSNQVVPEGDTIRSDPSVVYIGLESELPIIYGNLTIQGSTSADGTHVNGITQLEQVATPYAARFFTMVANGDSVTLQWLGMESGGAVGTSGSGINAGGNGGAIRSMTQLTIEDCDIEDNIALGYGGAVYQTMAPLTVIRTQFWNNRTDGHDGGAIYFNGGGGQALTVVDSLFSGNRTYVPYSNPYLIFSTDTGNCGAIFYRDYHGIVTITNTGFYHNSGANGGGVYLADVQNFYIGGDERAAFEYNQATVGSGGGLYAYVELTGSVDADFYFNYTPDGETNAFLIVLSPTATVSVNFDRVGDTYAIS
jgi:predicted outer membrane repeat protein